MIVFMALKLDCVDTHTKDLLLFSCSIDLKLRPKVTLSVDMSYV